MRTAFVMTQVTGWALADVLSIPTDDVKEWLDVILKEQKKKK